MREGFDTVETSGIDGVTDMVGESVGVLGTAAVEAQASKDGLVPGRDC